MRVLNQLWQDEFGATLSAELVLITTIVVIGLIVGLTNMRDGFVQELGDLAWGVGSLDQTYEYVTTFGEDTLLSDGIDFEFTLHQRNENCDIEPDGSLTVSVMVADSSFMDFNDDCDAGSDGSELATTNGASASGCIVICDGPPEYGENADPVPFNTGG